jgi:hypothetical protein
VLDEFRKVRVADHPVHSGFAHPAKSNGLSNLVIKDREVRHATPRLPGSPTSETEELARQAFLFPGLLPLGDEGFQCRAANEDRTPIIDRDEARFKPMADGVSVNAEEFCDFSRLVAT